MCVCAVHFLAAETADLRQNSWQQAECAKLQAYQNSGFNEDDGGSPVNKKGSRSARREGRVKGKQGGAEGEPGAAIPGATLRMSEWPPNDREV